MLLLAGCTAGALVWFFLQAPGLPQPSESGNFVDNEQSPMDLHASVLDRLNAQQWKVFHTESNESLAPPLALNKRYRLAGTFFSYDENRDDARMAIIDDLTKDKQNLVAENEKLDEFTVLSIQRDRVEFDRAGERLTLWLSFSGSSVKRQTAELPQAGQPQQQVLNENRFGKQIADNRWILKREALMDYYNELLDDPERIAAIYISLKPDYNANQKIKGYDLDMIGENDFFEAVGLQQGDIIRKVNSMNMVSQARGEYFLKEFVNSRLNAVVIDIERDSVPKKMIYLLR